MATTETGVVKKWLSDRAFGFLKPDLGGVDIFFHIEAFDGDEPQVGQRVSYEIATDTRTGKMRGVNVKPQA